MCDASCWTRRYQSFVIRHPPPPRCLSARLQGSMTDSFLLLRQLNSTLQLRTFNKVGDARFHARKGQISSLEIICEGKKKKKKKKNEKSSCLLTDLNKLKNKIIWNSLHPRQISLLFLLSFHPVRRVWQDFKGKMYYHSAFSLWLLYICTYYCSQIQM